MIHVWLRYCSKFKNKSRWQNANIVVNVCQPSFITQHSTHCHQSFVKWNISNVSVLLLIPVALWTRVSLQHMRHSFHRLVNCFSADAWKSCFFLFLLCFVLSQELRSPAMWTELLNAGASNIILVRRHITESVDKALLSKSRTISWTKLLTVFYTKVKSIPWQT